MTSRIRGCDHLGVTAFFTMILYLHELCGKNP